MDDTGTLIGITLAVTVGIAVGLQLFLHGRKTRIQKAREQEARDLEVKIRMSSGLDVINDFNELARVYVQLDRLNDAEQCMRKALSITENELGQLDPTLLPILENYANVLDKMNRTVESERMRKRARELSSRQK